MSDTFTPVEIDALSKCDLLSGIAAEDLAPLLDSLGAHAHTYDKDEIIFLAGNCPLEIGVVITGRVHLLRESFEGDSALLDELEASSTFGEAHSIGHASRSLTTVVASTPCKILLIPARQLTDLEALCTADGDANPRAARIALTQNLFYVLARQNLRLSRRISYLRTPDLRTRICRYLFFYQKFSGSSTFSIPFDRNELASFLAVNRSALSRELSRMRDDGLIEFSKNHFTVIGDLGKE